VNDLVRGQKVLSGREAVVQEMLSRYHNPEFIKAMQSEGYDGARYFSRVVDNQYGWNVVSDVITADDWKHSAEIYLDDKFRLGLREFFNRHNPYALQNIASRVLETHRKGLHKLDAKTLESAAVAYVETVAQHGAACASHICGNPELATLAERLAGASHRLADGTVEQFRKQLKSTGNAAMAKAPAATGASDQPAKAPKPVEGQVLMPPPPEPAPRPTDKGASPSPPPSVKNAQAPEQTGPSEPPETPSGPLRLATYLVAALCVVSFACGVIWRASRHRQRKRRQEENDLSR